MQNQVSDIHSWQIGLSQSPHHLVYLDAVAVTPIRWAIARQCNVSQRVFNKHWQEKLHQKWWIFISPTRS